MIRTALASVRFRLASFVGLFLTAGLTVALLAASGLLMASALTSGPGPDRFAATSLTVAVPRGVTLTIDKHKKGKHKSKSKTKPLTGAGVLPPEVLATVASTAGVSGAVPDFAFPVDITTGTGQVLRGPHGTAVIAHGWASAALTPYTLRTGAPPGTGQVVVDASVGGHVGDRIRLSTKTGTRELTISGITRQALDNQGAVFVTDSDVQAISGLSGPTAVAAFVPPGGDVAAVAELLRPNVGAARVLTGSDRISADIPTGLTSYTPAISVFGIMLAVTGFAALFVLIGSVGMVVTHRLRELALLRTVGATPRQLLRMLAIETAVVALLAGPPGLLLGVLAAGAVAGRFRAERVVPPQFVVSVNPFVLALALAAGTLIGVLAAFVAAGRATRIAPAEALRETALAPPNRVRPRLLVAAVLAIGAGCVLLFTPLGGNMGEGMSFISCALLLCAAVSASPLVVRLLSTLLTPVASAAGVVGQLAAAVVRANTRRVAAVAMPLMLLVGLIATLSSTSTLITHVAVRQQAARTAAADTELVPAGSGVPLAAATSIAQLDGVRGAAATIPTMVMVDHGGKPEHYPAQGVAWTGAAPLDLDVRHGNLDSLAAGEIAVSTVVAAAQHWSVGSQAGIWLADATHVSVRVVAIYELARGFGDVVLPAQLVADHDPRGLVRDIYLAGTPPTAAALAAWPVRVVDNSAPAGRSDAATQQVAFAAMTAILVGFIGVAVANAFALSIRSRRPEFGDLRLAGATPRQLHRMVDYETAMSVAIGIGLGAAVSGCVFGVFSIAQSGSWHWIGDPRAYAAILGGTGLLGLLAGAVPARLVIRRHGLAGDDV